MLDICLIELQGSIQYCSKLLVMHYLTTRPQEQLTKVYSFVPQGASALRLRYVHENKGN